MRQAVEELVARRTRTHLFVNLQPETWFGLLHVADAILGNSSSVLMESPSIPLPAVCVGNRQAGRERAPNVIDAAADPAAINRALDRALALEPEGIVNPYGDGHASERIVEAIVNAPSRFELLVKTTTLQHTEDAPPLPPHPDPQKPRDAEGDPGSGAAGGAPGPGDFNGTDQDLDRLVEFLRGGRPRQAQTKT